MIHEALLPAVAVATEETKGTPFVNEAGEVVTPPTTAQLMMWFQAYKQVTDATIASLTDTIGQLQTLLNGKASMDSLAAVRQRVTTTEATLLTKADTAYVSQQVQTIAGIDAGQADAIAGLTSLLATDGGLIQNMLAKQAGYDLLLPVLRTDVDAKATAATVSTLTGQVTSVRNAVNDSATGLATRASATDLASLTTTVAGKALATDLTTQKTRIDGLLTTTVPALQADTALRLLRTGDVATGPLVVPTASNKQAAPRFEQVFGGINSPRRTMENVTTGTTELVALTDTTGQNRKVLPLSVLFLLTGTLNLGSTVTLKLGTTPGGAELYTKTYSLLTGLLGKVLAPDLPATATPLPAGQRLYATITGGGQWTCFFDAVFLPTAS